VGTPAPLPDSNCKRQSLLALLDLNGERQISVGLRESLFSVGAAGPQLQMQDDT